MSVTKTIADAFASIGEVFSSIGNFMSPSPMREYTCDHCGGSIVYGLDMPPHKCKGVSIARVREIVREELKDKS